MITQAESGLSVGDYNDLVSGNYPYKYKVLARKWNIGTPTELRTNSFGPTEGGKTKLFSAYYNGSTWGFAIGAPAGSFRVNTAIPPHVIWDSANSVFQRLYVDTSTGALKYANRAAGSNLSISALADAGTYNFPSGNQQTLYTDNESYTPSGPAYTSTPAIAGGWTLADLFNPANPNPTSFYRGNSFSPATAVVQTTFSSAVSNCYKVKITSRDWTGLSGTKYSSRMIRNFDIETTTDAVNWVTALQVRKETNWGPKESRYYDIPLGNYRGVRLKIKNTNGSANIEIGKVQFVTRTSTTVNSVEYLAGTSWDYVFYAYRDFSKNSWNLRYLRRTGSMGSTFTDYNTGIYFQRPILSMDGCYNSTANEHVLAINMVETGSVVYKAEGAKAVPYVSQKSSTYTIKFSPQASGNPLVPSWLNPVDIVNPASSYKNREGVGINFINGMYMLTLRSYDANEYNLGTTVVSADNGTSQVFYSGYTSYKLYTSKDGVFWSNGYKIPTVYIGNLGVTPSIGWGAKPFLVGNEIQAHFHANFVDNKGYNSIIGFKFASSVMTGTYLTPTDITDEILEYSVDKSEFFSSSITLDNTSGAFTNHAVINDSSVAYLEHYHGIQRGPGDDVYILIGKTLVESISKIKSLDSSLVSITSRDLLALATDYTISEDAYYANSQRVFYDNYSDVTDSGYGGLAHTAKHKGALTAENGFLQSPDNVQCIAFSTFATDFRDFLVENWTYSHQGDKYGFIFKALDPKNYFFFEIEDIATANTVTCKLYYKRKNSYTLLNTWASVSLSDTQYRRYYSCFAGRFLFMTGTDFVLPGSDIRSFDLIPINSSSFYPDIGSIGFEITNVNVSEDTYTDENGVPATLPPGQVM